MSNTPMNHQAHLEAKLKDHGDKLEGLLENWRNSDQEAREVQENQIKSLKEEIGTVKDELGRRMKSSLPGSEPTGDPETDFSFGRAVRAIARKDFSRAPVEKEMFDNMRRKSDLIGGTDSLGGYLVPEQQMTDIVEALYANTVVLKLGAQELGNLTGAPVVIPTVATTAAAAWIPDAASPYGEPTSDTVGTRIAKTNPTFGQISMQPHSLAARVAISNLLMNYSVPAVEQVVKNDLTRQLAIGLDAAALAGSDAVTDGQPDGITVTAGVGTVEWGASTTTMTTPEYNQLQEFIADLRGANALTGSLGWAMSPTAFNSVMTILDVTNQSLERRVLSDGALTHLLGYPVETTTSLAVNTPTSAINSAIFGNFSDLMIARWGTLELRASDVADDAFSYDQTHVRGILRMDVGVRHAGSFSKSIDKT